MTLEETFTFALSAPAWTATVGPGAGVAAWIQGAGRTRRPGPPGRCPTEQLP